MSVPYYAGRQDKVAISDLVRELLMKFSELITTQVELTKAEIRAETRKLVTAAIFGLAAAAIGFVFILFMGVSLFLVMAQFMTIMWASLATTGIFLALAVLAVVSMSAALRKNTGDMAVD